MNLEIYNKVKEVPEKAKKPIKGGRMKGCTNINPMWRIKKLTEIYGPIGKGWYYKIIDKRLEKGCKEQISAFVDIELFVKYDDEWSKPIEGTGGSSFVTMESGGLYQSDECFKMALTDALSVSCKAIGIGADVYWDSDESKYDKKENESTEWSKTSVITFGKNKGKTIETIFKDDKSYIEYLSKSATDAKLKAFAIELLKPTPPPEPEIEPLSKEKIIVLQATMKEAKVSEKQILARYKVSKLEELTVETFSKAMNSLKATIDKNAKAK